MDSLGIPRDKPILLQVARFDRFKDPVGTIAAYRMVKKHFDCRLILAGGGVANDPEGEAVLADVRTAVGPDADIHVLQLPPKRIVRSMPFSEPPPLSFRNPLRRDSAWGFLRRCGKASRSSAELRAGSLIRS